MGKIGKTLLAILWTLIILGMMGVGLVAVGVVLLFG